MHLYKPRTNKQGGAAKRQKLLTVIRRGEAMRHGGSFLKEFGALYLLLLAGAISSLLLFYYLYSIYIWITISIAKIGTRSSIIIMSLLLG